MAATHWLLARLPSGEPPTELCTPLRRRLKPLASKPTAPEDLNTLQFVSDPIAVLLDDVYQARARVFQRLRAFDIRLRDVRSDGAIRLETLFPRAGYDAYTYSGDENGVTVGTVVPDRSAGFDVLYTVGVPVEGLSVFWSRVRDDRWWGGAAGEGVREHQADGGRVVLVELRASGVGLAQLRANYGVLEAAVRAVHGEDAPEYLPGGAQREREVVDEILAGLYEAVRPVPASAGTALLGPDLFGLRQSPPAPPFLVGLDQSRIGSEQLFSFFELLDLTRLALPTPADLSHLPAKEDSVWRSQLGPGQRSWPPDSGRDLQDLPPDLEMPLLLHSIWLGGPLTDSSPATREFRANVAELARQTGQSWRVLLWTDIPRATFDQARASQPAADGSDPLAAVRDMLEWARLHHVLLINVDEVFHAGRADAVGRVLPHGAGQAGRPGVRRRQRHPPAGDTGPVRRPVLGRR